MLHILFLSHIRSSGLHLTHLWNRGTKKIKWPCDEVWTLQRSCPPLRKSSPWVDRNECYPEGGEANAAHTLVLRRRIPLVLPEESSDRESPTSHRRLTLEHPVSLVLSELCYVRAQSSGWSSAGIGRWRHSTHLTRHKTGWAWRTPVRSVSRTGPIVPERVYVYLCPKHLGYTRPPQLGHRADRCRGRQSL